MDRAGEAFDEEAAALFYHVEGGDGPEVVGNLAVGEDFASGVENCGVASLKDRVELREVGGGSRDVCAFS